MAAMFKTPSNEKSFSQLIDNAIMATGKPQSLISIVGYANATIRECQTLGLFARDLLELEVVVPDPNNSSFYSWDRDSNLFRSIRTAKYLTADVYPELILPGRKATGKTYYFYAADNYYVFNGVMPGETIGIAAYYWAKRLSYFNQLGVNSSTMPGGPYDIRPAYFDEDSQLWMYLNADEDDYVTTLGDPVEEAARQVAALNWLITDWYDVVLAGTKAKIFASASDPRSSAEFAMYTQLKTAMRNTVGLEGEGF